MIFSGDLCGKVLDGTKTVTRRPVKHEDGEALPCRYIVNGFYAVQPGRGKKAVGRIRVVSIDRRQVLPITTNEAHWEGFATPLQFEEKWVELYGRTGPVDVWRIEFELVTA